MNIYVERTNQMDICQWMKFHPDTNYYDAQNGYFYHVRAYERAIKKGKPVYGVKVSLNGNQIGFVRMN